MKYKNLVISGGGLKGYYFLGALKYLFKNDILRMNYLKNILGVSIGSVIGYLLIIGYDIEFIIGLFLHMNISKYMPDIVIDKIFDEYYCLDCSKFNNIIKYLTTKKNINLTITLNELYEQSNIEFIIGTSNISLQKYEYISHKNNPNLSVLTALKMSYSLPLLFQPVIYNNHYYVDGGVINNYPIKYFKNDIDNTIGITLDTKTEEIKDIFSFVKNVMLASNKRNINKNEYNSIIIDESQQISILDFEHIDEHKPNMISNGYECAQKFHKKIKEINYTFVKNIILEIVTNINNG